MLPRVCLLVLWTVGCGRVGFDAIDADLPARSPDADITDASTVAITFPNNGNNIATTAATQLLSGTCDTAVVALTSSHGSFTDDDCSDGTWSLAPVALDAGGTTVVVLAERANESLSSAAIRLIYLDDLSRYRSASPGANSALAQGAGNELVINEFTATFATEIPDEVGVGDALQYDSSGDGTVDSLAFVHGRISDKELALLSAAGGKVLAVASTEDWALFRAYTSLDDAVHLSENTAIDAALRDFDGPLATLDLVALGATWNIACYGNGPDTTPVFVDNVTTDAAHYLTLFTPHLPWQVGVSQRHRGVWDPSAYHMVITNSDGIFVTGPNHMRVDGLQMQMASINTGNQKVLEFGAPGINDFRISNSIFWGAGESPFIHNSGLVIWNGGSGEARIWNNISYNFQRASTLEAFAYQLRDPEFTFYVNNNTAYGSRCGFSEAFGATVIAKNNLSYGNTENYCGNFMPSSSNNLSGPSLSDAPGSNPINAAAVLFVDEAGNDFHLAPQNAAALAAGLDLSNDAFQPVLTDIDGEARPSQANFDVGADQL